jgi:hypothetical protein
LAPAPLRFSCSSYFFVLALEALHRNNSLRRSSWGLL